MSYPLGALKNKIDYRDIHIAQVQSPVAIPERYVTDISMIPIFNQLSLGSCVGHAHAVAEIYMEYKETGKLKHLSPRYLYALAKKIDGYSGQGTYPRVVSGIQKDRGCATEDTVLNNNNLTHDDYIAIEETDIVKKDAYPYRIKGYVDIPNPTKEALKQAIYQNGVVVVTITIGGYDTKIMPGNDGFHRVLLYGYEGDKFYLRNSWGYWGDNGNGYIEFSDHQGKIYDAMTFVDIPDELLKETQNMYKYFKLTESTGRGHTVSELNPDFVKILDDARGIAGVPYKISNGFRTKAENDAIPGSAANSAHLRGRAVDLSCSDSQTRCKILWGLMQFRDKLFIEIAGGHIHVDNDSTIHPMGSVMWGDDNN